MTYDQAVVELGKLDLKYQVSSRQSSNDVEKDYIISQYPEAGETVRVNTVVKLVVSNGPNLIEVPDVTDLYEKEATSKLTNAGFTVSQIIYEYNDDYELGKVYQQNPLRDWRSRKGRRSRFMSAKARIPLSCRN
jgi:serine/threonine-protein kinase